MPRTRAMILTSIWSDPDFVALSPATKLVYLALLSQPDVNHLGLLSIAYSRWARALRGSVEWVRECVEELEEARFLVVDHETDQLLIRTFMRHDGVIKQPNILRAAASALGEVFSVKIAEALHQELALIDDSDYPASVGPILATMRAQLKGIAAKGSPNPSPNPSGNPSAKGLAKASKKGSENPLGDRGKGLGVTEEVAVRARARGTRIPEPFPITPEMVAWARERVPEVDGRLETEKFINYWRAKSGQAATKLDWPATWRNWMLAAAERLPSGRTGPVSSRSTTDDRVQQALDAGRRLQEQQDRGELGA